MIQCLKRCAIKVPLMFLELEQIGSPNIESKESIFPTFTPQTGGLPIPELAMMVIESRDKQRI
jgi:hypothetical protein